MEEIRNPYRKGSLIWSVMEGGWEDMTVFQIADALHTSAESIRSAIWRIQNDTGYNVPCADGRSVRWNGKDFPDPVKSKDPQAFPKRSKRTPHKCSTCADQKCRMRGSVCDWTHCGGWRLEVGSGGVK